MTDYTELKSRLRNGIDFDDSKEAADAIESLQRKIAEKDTILGSGGIVLLALFHCDYINLIQRIISNFLNAFKKQWRQKSFPWLDWNLFLLN